MTRRKVRAHSKVKDSKLTQDANYITHSMTENTTPGNMDLHVEVFGYTHRGGFKLRVSNIEELTDRLIDQWKSKCAELGYDCNVAYNASLSTAILHAVKKKTANPTNSSVGVLPPTANPFTRLHPLTVVAAVLFAVNAGRHLFTQ